MAINSDGHTITGVWKGIYRGPLKPPGTASATSGPPATVATAARRAGIRFRRWQGRGRARRAESRAVQRDRLRRCLVGAEREARWWEPAARGGRQLPQGTKAQSLAHRHPSLGCGSTHRGATRLESAREQAEPDQLDMVLLPESGSAEAQECGRDRAVNPRKAAEHEDREGKISGIAYNNLATIFCTGMAGIPPDPS
jgi:hypothetical protein